MQTNNKALKEAIEVIDDRIEDLDKQMSKNQQAIKNNQEGIRRAEQQILFLTEDTKKRSELAKELLDKKLHMMRVKNNVKDSFRQEQNIS